MKYAVLFSGGKDSTLALKKALDDGHVSCLISMISENSESYMFHTPNVSLTELQAQAMDIPLIQYVTKGLKEAELDDLKKAIQKAVSEYGIGGIVTGGVESVYQASRFQKICDELDLWCFNPLWQQDALSILHENISQNFQTIISGVYAYPFDESWVGKIIDEGMINDLSKLQNKFGLSPSGEGGEIETTVLDAPFFHKKIVVDECEVSGKNHSFLYDIKSARLVEK